jgi:hypothetical protein
MTDCQLKRSDYFLASVPTPATGEYDQSSGSRPQVKIIAGIPSRHLTPGLSVNRNLPLNCRKTGIGPWVFLNTYEEVLAILRWGDITVKDDLAEHESIRKWGRCVSRAPSHRFVDSRRRSSSEAAAG